MDCMAPSVSRMLEVRWGRRSISHSGTGPSLPLQSPWLLHFLCPCGPHSGMSIVNESGSRWQGSLASGLPYFPPPHTEHKDSFNST